VGLGLLFDPGRDVKRSYIPKGTNAGGLAPIEELADRQAVGAAGGRLRMLEAKNSRKRWRVSSPAAATMAGKACEVFRAGTSSPMVPYSLI
jgi:hypothetical protein